MFKTLFKSVNISFQPLNNFRIKNVHTLNSKLRKCFKKQHFQHERNLTLSPWRTAKLFVDNENNYCFNVLKNTRSELFAVKTPNKTIESLQEFNTLLNKNYRSCSVSEIVQTFKEAKQYCVENNIDISDTRFDKLVDGLLDNCEHLTDELLYDLLSVLIEYPPTPTYASHNFHDIWSCLDDICLWKMAEWDVDKMFLYADLWFKLNIGKLSDFVYEIINKLPPKADNLTKNQIVSLFFYHNVSRRQAVDYNYETAVEKHIGEMTADEMAIIALGYFKSKSKVKITRILEEMVLKVIKESKTIHEISLAAILKVIRMSKQGQIVHLVEEMLNKLCDELPRMSNLSSLHVALIGSSIQALHKKSLTLVTEKIVKDIDNIETVRLKDIERLAMVLSMFDLNPDTKPNFYEAGFKELHRPERLGEVVQYPRCLPSSLLFFSLRGIYSYELMDRVLNRDWIVQTYGKLPRSIGQDILSLDASISIECPDYKGTRLPPEMKYKAAKWQTEFIPSYQQYTKITAADNFFLNVVDLLKVIIKNDKFVRTDHVLPHFSRGDIILCKDLSSNKFIQPFGFENYLLGDVKFPFKDKNLKWYSVVIVGWNNTIRNTSLPLGHMLMKKRQLKLVGYEPVFVVWNEFMLLPEAAKLDYIKNKIL